MPAICPLAQTRLKETRLDRLSLVQVGEQWVKLKCPGVVNARRLINLKATSFKVQL
jgi:hypothetical protein